MHMFSSLHKPPFHTIAFRAVVVGTHDIFLVPISSRGTSYEAFARGFLRYDSKIECISLYEVGKLEKTKKSPVIFQESQMDVMSHVLTIFGNDGKGKMTYRIVL